MSRVGFSIRKTCHQFLQNDDRHYVSSHAGFKVYCKMMIDNISVVMQVLKYIAK